MDEVEVTRHHGMPLNSRSWLSWSAVPSRYTVMPWWNRHWSWMLSTAELNRILFVILRPANPAANHYEPSLEHRWSLAIVSRWLAIMSHYEPLWAIMSHCEPSPLITVSHYEPSLITISHWCCRSVRSTDRHPSLGAAGGSSLRACCAFGWFGVEAGSDAMLLVVHGETWLSTAMARLFVAELVYSAA